MPTGLIAAAGYGTIQATWTAATNFPTGYNVKRSTTNGGPYTVIASGVTGTAYLDTSVLAGTNYYYVVSSLNYSGESADSSTANATAFGSLNVWHGGLSTNWDTTTANWLQAGTASAYQNGSAVWFDDTALANTVNLAASVTPSAVTFNNSSLSYTLTSSGANGINGTNALVKMGTATLALSGTNTFSGGLAILNGAVQSDNTNALGTGTITLGDGVSANHATLLALPASATFGNSNPIVVAAGGSGVYEIQSTGNKDYHLSGGLALNNALTLSTTAGGALFLDGTLTSGPANPVLTINGAGTTSKFVDLTASNSSTFTGNVIVVDNGDLKSGNVNSLSSTNTVYLDNTATLDNGSLNLTIAGLNDYGIGGGTVADAGSGKILTLAGGGIYSFSGVINNIGGLLKTNTGTQVLSGANTFTGPATISQGTLVISTLHSGNNAFTLNNGATLSITNEGNAQSAVLYSLALGSGVPTTLEFQNISNPAVPLIVASNVTLNGTCSIQVTGTNSLTGGSTYPLINYSGAFSGAFGNFTLQMPTGWAGTLVSNANQIALKVVSVPAAPTGLSAGAGAGQAVLFWNPSATATGYYLSRSTASGGTYSIVAANYGATSYTNTGLANGVVYYYVVSATNAAGASANSPQISVQPIANTSVPMGFAVANGQLQINWPTDHIGWLLQAQTNSLSLGLGGNWTTVSGSALTNFSYQNINLTNGGVFYRLIHP